MTEREIFEHALQIADPQQRADYLREVCGADQDLAQRVEGLLAARSAADSFLETPAGIDKAVAGGTRALTQQTSASAELGSAVGDVIAAKYKLLQTIGEGGMGVVYMAEQRQPIVRRVAVKIIKPGMQSAEILARFEAERQALAVMDHPHIAKVFDAGTTEAGLPFFVMELVQGIPITHYCDEGQLSLPERLALFIPVCQAVQHAHQKGVIHRDIKPSNVLVTQYDGMPVPKVIDFGVAKAVGQKLTDRTLFTQFGAIVGTLEYMSPEQATLNALDVDTRSDIYSLGVLLYELLTGETPLDRRLLRTVAFDEVLRVIRCEEPPKPSTRLSSSARLPAIAALRHVEPKRLASLVRGDLDWIVMKSLEKERNRRYSTAKDLSDDVERYLAIQPISAGPPSAWYRMRKFSQRRRGRLLALASLATVVIISAGTIFWLASHTRHLETVVTEEQQRASQAQRETQETRRESQRWQMLIAALSQIFNLKTDDVNQRNTVFDMLEKAQLDEAQKVRVRALKMVAVQAQQLLDEGEATQALDICDQAAAMLKGLPKSKNDPANFTELTTGAVLAGRGAALDLLHRDAEADSAWNQAFSEVPVEVRPVFYSEQMSSLLRAGNMIKALALAEQWIGQPDPSPPILFAEARVYARATAWAKTPEAAEDYRKKAIALLGRLEKQGYFAPAMQREELATEADWKPLRGLEAFEQLVSRVTTAPPPKQSDAGGAVTGAFSLISAGASAAKNGDDAQAIELFDQSMAQLESNLPLQAKDLRLYIAAVRKVLAGLKLSQQGEHAQAAALFDEAEKMANDLSKLPSTLYLPPRAIDTLREMIKAGREGKAPSELRSK